MRRLALCAALALGACGGDDDGDVGPSGLERGKSSGELTDDEVRTLCDWVVGNFGGPGIEVECEGGGTLVTPTEEECFESAALFRACEGLTVADFEDCQLSMDGDICVALNTPECAEMRACLGA